MMPEYFLFRFTAKVFHIGKNVTGQGIGDGEVAKHELLGDKN